MDQWFIKIDHVTASMAEEERQHLAKFGVTEVAAVPSFRAYAIAEKLTAVNWIPDWGVNRIKSAVQSRPDWCISRQRTWACRFLRSMTRRANRFLTRKSSATPPTSSRSTARMSGLRNPPVNSGRS